MYVLEVLPLTPGAPSGTLSYRSAKKVQPGTLVTVTLRRRRVPGVVIASEAVLDAKASLKAASFMLSGSVSEPIGKLPKPFMEAVERISTWHAAPQGSVLAALLAESIAGGGEAPFSFPTKPGGAYALTPLELPIGERAARYRHIVAGQAKEGRATLLVVSTIAEVEYWKRALADQKPLVLFGSLTGARRAAAFAKARAARSLVISTPAFSFAPLTHLGHVIVERIGAGGFRLPKRPYLDVRVAHLELARGYERPIVLGDFPLPLEYRADARALPEGTPQISILDSRKDPLSTEEAAPWSAVSEALRSRMTEALARGGRIAVLAVRKGYAPVVVCRDCGQALRDKRGAVYAFTQEGGERRFRTSDGASVLGSDITCPNCGSWNLLPLGVGIERVVEELHAAFPDAPLVQFDADAVRTAAAAKKRLESLAAPGAIVVGTEAMVPWLLAAAPEGFSLAAIASADSLLALPFWRARERLVRLAYLFAATAAETVISTRLPDDTAMRIMARPHDTAFFDEEIVLRSALGYPPFGTLIALQFTGTARTLEQLERTVRETIGDSDGRNTGEADAELVLRALHDRPLRGSQYRRTIVLMLPRDVWPDPALSARLASLPPSIRVLIDPESFW